MRVLGIPLLKTAVIEVSEFTVTVSAFENTKDTPATKPDAPPIWKLSPVIDRVRESV